MNTSPPLPRLEPALDVVVELGAIEDHGDTSAGHRRVVPIVGGSIDGDVVAEVLAGGADWQRVRPDGSIEIDGRYSARTADGEMLYLQVRGLRTGPASVLEALGRGEVVASDRYLFRTLVVVETAAPRLRHLERSLLIASCVRDAATVRYRAYRVL